MNGIYTLDSVLQSEDRLNWNVCFMKTIPSFLIIVFFSPRLRDDIKNVIILEDTFVCVSGCCTYGDEGEKSCLTQTLAMLA